MNIYPIDASSVGAVAELMSAVKPDWWDYEGAFEQLRNEKLLARLVGWYIGEENRPRGWLLCAEYEGYSCLSIENLGYDEDGRFSMEGPLEPLLRRAEAHAREKGLRNLKYIISSTQMSCHGRPLEDPAKELAELRSLGWEHYDFFRAQGFRPTGFLPNCYGMGWHGILMVKDLTGSPE